MNDNPFQGTAEWFESRTGCLTASRMADVLAVSKRDGKPLKARQDYLRDLLAERLTGHAMPHVVTPAMRDGIEREPLARAAYEIATGSILRLTGFVPHPTIEFFGASPDALVGAEGLVEFKCPTVPTHMDWLIAGVVPDEYKPQMLSQLACTRRKWCDFVSWNPEFRESRQLFVRRFEPTAKEIAAVEESARAFLKELDAMFRAFTEKH